MTQTVMATALANQLLTLEEFYNYDDGSDIRYELVDGELIAMPTESPANCTVARRLFAQLLKLIPIEWLSYKEIMLEVSGRRAKVRIPDMMILGEECYAAIKDQSRGIITQDMPSPLIAIEVVSTGRVNESRDYRYKRSEYAVRGIAEYWIVDPSQRKFTVLTLVEGFYEEVIYGLDDTFRSGIFPELEVKISDILNV
ncbi:Uma2 family endonuclease [Pseudanabaena sp. FACHB-1998]|uniref:Uma2 family endonuclease n=1 Tax=Pseudanabaena sp. FACHB-1998 TaxID=2692858 RepID=UPI001F5516EC|nr:Uma2 family endonuclease [Pseudanabaena sp. FACHB-1998]